MILSMTEQMFTFLAIAGIGFLVGFFYDFLRLIRRFVKHSSLACNIEDGIYWMLVLILVFYFIQGRFYGEVRFFSVMGFFIGMALYFLSISWLILSILSGVWVFLAKVIKAVIKIILFPVKIIVTLVKIPLRFILSHYRRYSVKTKKVLHKSSRYAKIKSKRLKRDMSIIVKRV